MDNTFLDFEDIPTYNFYKISETGDMRWFLKDFRETRSGELSPKDELVLVNRFKEIYDARIAYTQDFQSKVYYQKIETISNLEAKYFRLTTCFNVLTELHFTSKLFYEYKDYFENDEKIKCNIKIKNKKDAIRYLNKLKRKISGFKMKLNIKRIEYKDILEEPKEGDEKPKFDLIKEKVILQEVLDGINIDIYTTPLIEWCAMSLRAQEKSNEAKKRIEKMKKR